MTTVSPLERLVPGLRGQRTPLGDWPTPVRALDVGGDQPLWCKDEGRAAARYGGNKVRKLEWWLARLPAGAPIVTAGAVGSNHVLATAVHAGMLGHPVHAILVPQPDTDAARRTAAVSARLVHRTWPARDELRAVALLPRAVAAAWRETGVRPRVVWIGGTTPRGILGWVDGALELADQVAAGELPAPARVYVPAGSGGIAAGLLTGFRLAGLPTRVHAVRVADPVWANRRTILGFARLAARELRRAGARLPALDPTRLVLDVRWLGPGYGTPTEAGARAATQARALGLGLEPTYSAKTLAAAIDAVTSDRLEGPVLWIDTANARPVADLVDGTIPPPPPELERLLTPIG